MLEINESVFGKMKYEYRWIKEEIFHIFNKDQSIKICAKAFNYKVGNEPTIQKIFNN